MSENKKSMIASWREKDISATRTRITAELEEVLGKDFATSTEGVRIFENVGLLARHNRALLEVYFLTALVALFAGLGMAWFTLGHSIFGVNFQSGSLLWPYQTARSFLAALCIYGVAAILSILLFGGFAALIGPLNERVSLSRFIHLIPVYVLLVPALPRILNALGYLAPFRSRLLQTGTAALFATTMFWFGFICVAFALTPVLAIVRYAQIASNPAMYFQYMIMRSLFLLRRLPSLPHSDFKVVGAFDPSLALCISTAATALRAFRGRYLNQLVLLDDWYRQALDRRAIALEGLQKWLLLPKADTRIHLENKLREYLRLAATDSWDALPDVDLSTKPPGIWQRTGESLRTLLVAGLPPAIVFLLKKHDMLPAGQFELYIIVGACLWALAHIMPLLDPRFGEKFATIKDFSSLPFFSKGKD